MFGVADGRRAASIAAGNCRLTEAMLHSGASLIFPACGPKVTSIRRWRGDKTSLVIAPIVAAGGVKSADDQRARPGSQRRHARKLESIPGFNVNLSLADFRRVLEHAAAL